MTWRTRVYLELGFALGGGVLGFVLSPWLLSVLPDWENASLPTKLIGFAGFTLGSYGIGILGVLLGAVVGLIFALGLPGRRVACPACGNPAASARDRSLFTGRTLPNRCAACHHTW